MSLLSGIILPYLLLNVWGTARLILRGRSVSRPREEMRVGEALLHLIFGCAYPLLIFIVSLGVK